MVLAVAQQFHDRAWRSPAGDDRVTRWLNAGNVEGEHGVIGIRRAGRYGKRSRLGVCLSLCRRRVEPSSRAPDAVANAGAAVAALVSTGGSRRRCVMSKTSAAPHAATSARDGTTIRPIDAAVIIAPLGQIVGSSAPQLDPAPICSGHQVCLTGIHRSVVLTNKNRGGNVDTWTGIDSAC